MCDVGRWVWIFAVGLLGSAFVVAASPLSAEDGPSIALVDLDDASRPHHAAAREAWRALPVAERTAFLLSILEGDNEELATLAAEGLGSDQMDAEQCRRAMELLVRHPVRLMQLLEDRPWWSVASGPRAWGSVDLVPFFKAAARLPTGQLAGARLTNWHRVLHPHDIWSLVDLLETPNAEVFTTLRGLVAMAAAYDREDRDRDRAAFGLAYILLRLEAEQRGQAIPTLGDTQIQIRADVGLPRTFGRLVEAHVLTEASGAARRQGDATHLSEARHVAEWLTRWARSLEAAPADLPLLSRIVEGDLELATPLGRWALEQGVRAAPGSDPGFRMLAESLATPGNRGAAAAARALVRIGREEPARALLDAWRGSAEGRDRYPDALGLLWSLDRGAARERVVAMILAGGARDTDGFAGLEPRARHGLAQHEGVIVGPADVAWIGDRLWARQADVLTLLRYHADVWPRGLTHARARTLLARLSDLDLDHALAVDHGWLIRGLALLEARDQWRLETLLGGWARRVPAIRTECLQWLARLGSTTHVAEMVEDWATWDPHLRLHLARVHDPRVADAMRTYVAMSEEDGYGAEDLVWAACGVLLLQAGLPESAADVFARGGTDGKPPLPRILDALRNGRAREVAVDLATAASAFHRRQGESAGTRALEDTLWEARQARTDREDLWLRHFADAYDWDPESTAQVSILLGDDRLWVYEALPDHVWYALDRFELLDEFVPLLDSNCCLGFEAAERLLGLHPTFPFEDAAGFVGSARTQGWFRNQPWTWSRLLDGYVQAAAR